MAEFVTVMSEFMRLCDSFQHCEDCPVDQAGFSCECDHQGCSKTGAAELEHIIMAWAAEHPEPVYPTWVEYLVEIGVIPHEIRLETADALMDTHLLKPIPADIAEKLGLRPNEE